MRFLMIFETLIFLKLAIGTKVEFVFGDFANGGQRHAERTAANGARYETENEHESAGHCSRSHQRVVCLCGMHQR